MLSSSLLRVSRAATLRTASCRFFGTKFDGPIFDKVGFIGVGKMAQAMIEPMIKSGLQPASQIAIYDVSTTLMNKAARTYSGIQTTQSAKEGK
jgi:ornithine cyclodeaminase/alanine dehydrogenase-like protein (mu-crystallin family)